MGTPRSREKAGLDERGRHARHVLACGEWGGGGQVQGQCGRAQTGGGRVEGIGGRAAQLGMAGGPYR